MSSTGWNMPIPFDENGCFVSRRAFQFQSDPIAVVIRIKPPRVRSLSISARFVERVWIWEKRGRDCSERRFSLRKWVDTSPALVEVAGLSGIGYEFGDSERRNWITDRNGERDGTGGVTQNYKKSDARYASSTCYLLIEMMPKQSWKGFLRLEWGLLSHDNHARFIRRVHRPVSFITVKPSTSGTEVTPL